MFYGKVDFVWGESLSSTIHVNRILSTVSIPIAFGTAFSG